jgi:hypothetical protein
VSVVFVGFKGEERKELFNYIRRVMK